MPPLTAFLAPQWQINQWRVALVRRSQARQIQPAPVIAVGTDGINPMHASVVARCWRAGHSRGRIIRAKNSRTDGLISVSGGSSAALRRLPGGRETMTGLAMVAGLAGFLGRLGRCGRKTMVMQINAKGETPADRSEYQ
jgi:hypothetical protein